MTLLICIALILASIGVITFPKPVHASLSFLLTLLLLSTLYFLLSAQFIGAMQVLVYAGAILVIFMYVIVLFQDAYQNIAKFKSQSSPLLLITAGSALLLSLLAFATRLTSLPRATPTAPQGFGDVETLGKALYLDFFFPFEAVILIFLIAIVGVLYIGKRSET